MNTDTSPASYPDIPDDALVIFIGHSDDANEEAQAVLSLQSKLERTFREYLALSGGDSGFQSLWLWEWNKDASSRPGGQQTVVAHVLSQAKIGLFVFKERIGAVTWDELETMRERSKTEHLQLLAFFPEEPPNSLKLGTSKDASQWLEVLTKRDELTGNWVNPGAASVTPLEQYRDCEHLKTIAFERLSKAIHAVLCEQSKPVKPQIDFRLRDLDRRYRATLSEELNKIRMLGSPVIDSIKVGLDDTFVPLRISHTWRTDERFSKKKPETAIREEMRPHTPDELMLRVFPAYRLLLVIGDPGAGKTTLLKYYALCCLQEKQARLFGDGAPMVRVFYLPLRELKLDDRRNYRPLPEQLFLWAEARANTIDAEVFEGWLRDPDTKSLVLFDGLDEISDIELRKVACEWIDKQYSGFPGTNFVVTSRLTGYRKTEGVELEADHIRADVMDFTAEQQAEFLSKWFKAAYIRELCPFGLDPEMWIEKQKKEAEDRTRTIVEHLNNPGNRGLRELAAVPMMLQIMAILWKERHVLPRNRVTLYSAALDYLLEYRDDRRKIPPLLPADKARLVLAPVALWMQEELESDEAERTAMHSEMEKVLCMLDHPPSAEAFCRNLIDRAGLLVEYGEQRKEYLFRHKTFREYLAGGQLTEKIKRNSGLIAPLVEHFGEDWWNEPLTFFMAQSDGEMFDRFMDALFDSEKSAEFSPKQQTLLETIITEAPQKTTGALCRKLLQSGTTANRQRYILDCLKALGKPDTVETLQLFLEQKASRASDVRSKAMDVLTGIDPAALASITMISRESRDALGSQYILIPGGKYIYSVTEKEVTVPDLWFGKYPVTNRQYRSFIGFLGGKQVENTMALTVKTYTQALHDLAHSGEDILKGFDQYLKGESDLVRRFTSYYDDDRKYNKDEQPVVGVTWFNARAYSLWLSMLSGAEYRLPTEEEWEWAAGGRREEQGKVLKVKKYPWGDKPEPTPKYANFNGNEGATTPGGRYPDGATPEGLYDMAGNVWEWMGNRYSKDTSAVSLRGGSWFSISEFLRCRARDSRYPGYDHYVGFRVVCPSRIEENYEL